MGTRPLETSATETCFSTTARETRCWGQFATVSLPEWKPWRIHVRHHPQRQRVPTDQNGNTTGSIRNGQIFLNNSDGGTTTGTYDHRGNIYTTTTPSVEEQQRQLELQRQQQQLEEQRRQQINQQNYDAGYALGSAIGGAIAGGIASHRITAYCKSNPKDSYLTGDGITIQCPNAPLSTWENRQANAYCADNPGRWIEFGRRRVDCLTPPNPANLKWAKWELNEWASDYHHRAKAKMKISSDQIRSDWEYWQGVYCRLAPGNNFRDLDGKKQRCQ